MAYDRNKWRYNKGYRNDRLYFKMTLTKMQKIIYPLFILVMAILVFLPDANAVTMYAINVTWNGTIPNLYSSNRTWNTQSNKNFGNVSLPPTAADVVTFDQYSAPVFIDKNNCTSNSFTVTGTQVNITWMNSTSRLDVTGILTLKQGMNLTPNTTNSMINLSYLGGASLALTPDNVAWGGQLFLQGNAVAATLTMGSNWQVNNLAGYTNAATYTLNGNTLTITNGTFNNAILAGTTILNMTGGIWKKANVASSIIKNSVTFSGDVTLDDIVYWGGTAGRTLSYSSGTITIPVNQTLHIGGAGTINLPVANVPLQNFKAVGSTITLSQDLHLLGKYYASAGTVNGYTIYAQGIDGTGGSAGTMNLVIEGDNVNWTRTSSGVTQNNVTINVSSLTVGNGVSWCDTGRRLIWVNGTVNFLGSFVVFASCYMNVSGMQFNTLTIGGTSTPFNVILGSNLNITNSLIFAKDRQYNFIGAYNVTTNYLYIPTNTAGANYTLNLTAGTTLKVNSRMKVGGWLDDTFSFGIRSSTPGSKAYINYQGTPQTLMLLNVHFTNIQATGRRLDDWFGSAINTTNIRIRTPYDFYNLYGVI